MPPLPLPSPFHPPSIPYYTSRKAEGDVYRPVMGTDYNCVCRRKYERGQINNA